MERKINKVSQFFKTRKERKQNFLQKKFCFLSEKTPPAESSQREKEIFFAKKISFSLFSGLLTVLSS
jgi:hypothetical protein